MASSVIGALRVNLGLDSAKFESGARRVQQPLQAMRKQFVAVSAVAVAMGAALSAAALKGAQEIDKSAKAARRLGTSIGSFRALELAAGEAGVSLSTLTDGVQTMDREIAKGSKGAARALDTLGLSAKDLGGLEADEKVALIADRIKALGLTTGQASVVLQDLGVRNREMVLAVLAGGDAFRNARKDIEDYGLAISATDASAIEQANDRIGRLGLIGQYAGQQLAIALVPALGAMAQAMTDSLREGGLLRAVIDGLVGNIERLGTYVAVVVTGFGVRYVGALVAAKLATATLSGALVVLRGALIRTGIGALVIAAGELVYWLMRVITASGGVGVAISRIYDVGKATFLAVGRTAWGLMDILAGVASAIVGSFVRAFALIAKSWDMLINGMAAAWNAIAGTGLGDKLGLGTLGKSDISGAVGSVADGLFGQAEASIRKGGARIAAAGKSVAEAIKASMVPIENGNVEEGVSAADRLAASLDGVTDSAAGPGGSGAGGAAGAVGKIKPQIDKVSEGMSKFKNSVSSAFEGLITGAMSFKEALSSVLKSLASIFAEKASAALFGSFNIPGFATGTSYAAGGLAAINERGGELVNLPRGSQVIPHDLSKRMIDRSGGGVVRLVIEEGPMFASRVRTEATGVAVEVTRKGISDNNRAQGDARYLRGGS